VGLEVDHLSCRNLMQCNASEVKSIQIRGTASLLVPPTGLDKACVSGVLWAVRCWCWQVVLVSAVVGIDYLRIVFDVIGVIEFQ
jgi:hypothetical protein